MDIKASSLTQKGLTLVKPTVFFASLERILNVLVKLTLLMIYLMKGSARFYFYHFNCIGQYSRL